MSNPPPGEPDPEQPPSPYEQPRQPYEQPGQPYGQPGQPYEQPYGQGGQHQQHWGQQPPYPPQGPYGQYGPPTPGQGGGGPNVLAILSLVLAFVFPPAGIVCGHLAKRQIRRTGEEGDQLATWGLILSYIFTVIGVLACCGWIAVAIWANSDSGSY